MSNYAPIILFVYNRPWHTEQTLTALKRNAEAKESILFIYADGPKEGISIQEQEKIDETRRIIKSQLWCSEVHIVESDRNKGLANSIISATTEIVNKYGKVITLEDDVVVSRYFLRFLNEGLNRYEKHKNVFTIQGYIFPVKAILDTKSSFFLPMAATQAWGTWKRAWDLFDSKASGYEELQKNKRLRFKFNLDGNYDFSSMLFNQMESDSISSWAILWWWVIYKKKGLSLFPEKSLIKNIGWDGSGRHCGEANPFYDSEWDEDYYIKNFPSIPQIDKGKFRSLKKYLGNLFVQKKPFFHKKIFIKGRHYLKKVYRLVYRK